MRTALITHEGLARLTEELEHLTTTARRAAAERIRHALSTDANAAENADYLDAREEQALLEQRIALLRERIAIAEPVEPDPENGAIDLGERVHLRDLDTGERIEYELVGSAEADPLAARISVASPLGQALLGRRRGEVVVADAPKGRLRFKVLSIRQRG